MQTEKATFGAGCFWGVEEIFRNVKGVLSTSVGYAGGTQENPTYQNVCTDKTGHAEVVAVEFDPSQVSYDELLDEPQSHYAEPAGPRCWHAVSIGNFLRFARATGGSHRCERKTGEERPVQ